MPSWYRYTKEDVLLAITGDGDSQDGCKGIVSTVAKRLGCAWHTAKKYIGVWKETREAYEDESERSIDLSESKMFEQIKAGDGPMIRYHLSTKGKHRGYSERRELTGAEGGPIIVVNWDETATPSED